MEDFILVKNPFNLYLMLHMQKKKTLLWWLLRTHWKKICHHRINWVTNINKNKYLKRLTTANLGFQWYKVLYNDWCRTVCYGGCFSWDSEICGSSSASSQSIWESFLLDVGLPQIFPSFAVHGKECTISLIYWPIVYC